jgi:hypothetical protein
MKQAMHTLAQYAKIAGKSLFKSLLMGISGFLYALVCGLASLFLVYNDPLAPLNYVAMLSVLCNIGAGVFYVVFAQKLFVQTAIYLVWKEKLGDFFMPKISEYVAKLMDKSPNWFKETSQGTLLKAQLLESARHDSQLHKVQRLVLQYGLAQINVSDLKDVNPDTIPSLISSNIRTKIDEMAEPSLQWYWWIAAGQMVLLAIAFALE